MKIIACVLFLLSLISARRFDGYSVLRVNATTATNLDFLTKLQDTGIIDVWSRDSVLGFGMNDIMVPRSLIALKDMEAEILIPDVQHLIDNEREAYAIHSATPGADWYESYHTYDEMIAQLNHLANNYPHLVTLVPSIGKSIEGRDIPAVRITSGSNAKEVFFISAGQHAREWVGPAATFWVIQKLLTGAHNDTQALLARYEFVIVPIVNPDGYTFSWTTSRLWRKNRRLVTGTTYGVDLNRNWDNHWGGSGSSGVPSSDTYRGASAFSEPETTALSRYLTEQKNVAAAVDIHSYSQLLLRPWGWTTARPSDYQMLFDFGARMATAILKTHGMVYENIAAAELYLASGGASDWYYASAKVVAYTFELRDTGRYGFVLPANQIIPTAQETFNALRVLAEGV